MLCQQFLDIQLLCFLYKPYYAHIMLSYMYVCTSTWNTCYSCSSEECTSCSDVDANKAEGTVSLYPDLQRRPGYEELLILNLLHILRSILKVPTKFDFAWKHTDHTILLTRILYYAGICSYALRTIKLCWYNPPRPTWVQSMLLCLL